MSQNDRETKRIEARKAVLAIRMRSATGDQRQGTLREIVDLDLKLLKIKHVLPEYR